MKIGHSSLENLQNLHIPSFISCLYNDKNGKSDIWQQLSVDCLVFFSLTVCLMLVWVIFVSVVWMYVSYSLPEVAYLEYIYAEKYDKKKLMLTVFSAKNMAINPFHATDILYLWFSNVFRGYRKSPVAWNGLKAVQKSDWKFIKSW